jgi:hypothetical protein
MHLHHASGVLDNRCEPLRPGEMQTRYALTLAQNAQIGAIWRSWRNTGAFSSAQNELTLWQVCKSNMQRLRRDLSSAKVAIQTALGRTRPRFGLKLAFVCTYKRNSRRIAPGWRNRGSGRNIGGIRRNPNWRNQLGCAGSDGENNASRRKRHLGPFSFTY